MKDYEKISVSVKIFFEIENSEIYGGGGSVGYAESSLNGMGSGLFEGYVSEQKKAFAELMKVPEECVKVITEAEYKESMDEEGDLE